MPDLDVVAVIKAKPGSESVIGAALASVVEPTLAEEGCLAYELFVSQNDAATFVTVEKWRSQDDLNAHLRTPHIREALGSLGDQLDGAPLIMPLSAV